MTLDTRPSLSSLYDKQAALTARMEELKAQSSALDDQIVAHYGDDLIQEFDDQDKTFGQVTVDNDDMQLTGKIDKRVTWDSKALQAIAEDMPWEAVSKLFTIKFTIPEKKFVEVYEPTLREKLMAARTLKAGTMKVSISQKK